MKLENIVYDIRTVYRQLGDDTELTDDFLINKINSYRATLLERQFFKGVVDLSAVQDVYAGYQDTTTVNSADDIQITKTSIVITKLELPATVKCTKWNGVHQILHSAQHKPISYFHHGLFMSMIENNADELSRETMYTFVGKKLYFYPKLDRVRVYAILENPLDGFTKNALLTPQGISLSASGTKRNLTILDEYPVDVATAQNVILAILTQYLNLQKQSIEDLANDGQSQLKLLGSGTQRSK
jgi:hypothetical protein